MPTFAVRINAFNVLPLGYSRVDLLMGANLLRDSKIVMESRSPRFYEVVQEGRGADYDAVTTWLRRNAEPQAVVPGYEYTTLHCFTGLHTLPTPLKWHRVDLAELRRLLKEGRAQYVVADERKGPSAALMARMRTETPEALTRVVRSGQVTLLRVDRAGIPAAAGAG